jgi:hypothetical protein
MTTRARAPDNSQQAHAERPSAPGARPERRGIPFREQLPQPSLEYRSTIGRWLRSGESVDDVTGGEIATHPWWKVIWLTGVEYFSTLGYHP